MEPSSRASHPSLVMCSMGKPRTVKLASYLSKGCNIPVCLPQFLERFWETGVWIRNKIFCGEYLICLLHVNFF